MISSQMNACIITCAKNEDEKTTILLYY